MQPLILTSYNINFILIFEYAGNYAMNSIESLDSSQNKFLWLYSRMEMIRHSHYNIKVAF